MVHLHFQILIFMFTKETYIRRRAQLKAQIKHGIVLFLTNNEASMNYPSNTYRYRQDSTFTYFFGLQLPGLVGVIDIDDGVEKLFGDDFGIDDIIWMGNQPTMADLACMCGVAQVHAMGALQTYLSKAVHKNRRIHFLPPYRDDNKIFLSNMLNLPIDQLQPHASEELIRAVVNLRAVKTAEEIEEMDKVCDLGVLMHTTVMKECQIGKVERELAGRAEGIAISGGAGVSFPVILSQNGETLHNHHHEQVLRDGRLLLADMGAESVSGYSSDYTRTFPVNGKFSQKQKEIYEIVLQANLESIAMAKPGIRYWDVHLNAATVIAKGLTELGLMKGDYKAAAIEGANALFMPHGLGHMLGLDVHDMEDLGENYVGYDNHTFRSPIFGHGSLRCGRELQQGFIVTDEPGIYFIPQLIDIWEREQKFSQYINYNKVREYIGFGGIRIEDDVLITETGCRVLGKPLPKQVHEIEEIVGSGM